MKEEKPIAFVTYGDEAFISPGANERMIQEAIQEQRTLLWEKVEKLKAKPKDKKERLDAIEATSYVAWNEALDEVLELLK